MVETNALASNWWSVYTSLIDPNLRRDAKTSHSTVMDGVARV